MFANYVRTLPNIAIYNSSGYYPLKQGLNGVVQDLLILNNKLFAGGFFDADGLNAITCSYIAQFDLLTETWSNLRKIVQKKI